MHCATPVAEGSNSPEQEGHFCILCGRLLPDGSTSDVCEHCLHGEASTPDATAPLDEISMPSETESGGASRKRPNRLLPVLAVGVFLLVGVGIFAAWRSQRAAEPPPETTVSSPAGEYAVSCAQEMVRAAAYDPNSVHFLKSTLEAAESDGLYTVQQTFERRVATGETVESSYVALLTLREPLQSGYDALRLQVDDTMLYDYSAG